ncbi:MAG: hypothetical protein MK081_14725 [Flavobacteriales bacterium]|nr:hypothetical protein [Flavobacteriales bacterium]
MRNSIVAGVSGAILSLLVCLLVAFQQQETIAYVDSEEVFDSFQYKLRLEQELKQFESDFEAQMDSLKIARANAVLRGESKEALYVFDLQLREISLSYEEEAILKSNQYNEQIWSRLEQYLDEFGVHSDVDILMGRNGLGQVLHVEEDLDLTQQAISFVNDRFNGKAFEDE